MPRAVRVVLRLLGALVVVAVAVVAVTAGRVWWTARQDDRPRSDAIVVLGASQYNGRPSAVLRSRLEHALQLWQDKVAPVIVTVGGRQPGDQYTEAGAGRQWLHEHGVPTDDLVAVETGDDTLASMKAVAAAMRQRSWDTAVLVTDPWHSLRAAAMARDQGLDVATSPTRSGPANASRETELRYIVRETGAYLYYRIFGESGDSGVSAV
ncbi:MAG: YdcF family protein [Actinomycetes bacterium]